MHYVFDVSYELADANIARLVAPLDSSTLEGFVAALVPVNAAADGADGFRWRLQTDSGDATAIRAFEWPRSVTAHVVIVDLSAWADVESLADVRLRDCHRRRCSSNAGTWFERAIDAHDVLLVDTDRPPSDHR